MKNLTVVEFSARQQCFHVESLEDMISSNIRAFKGQSMTDYLPIGIFKTREEAHRFLDKAHAVLDERG